MRQLRTERKWSQLELEFRLHSSSKQIRDVELGKKKVSLLYAKRVADVFGITLHELFDLIEQYEQYIKETEG